MKQCLRQELSHGGGGAQISAYVYIMIFIPSNNSQTMS